MKARLSSPLIELMGGRNSLVLPEALGTKSLCFWVSSSESFSNPGVVKPLPVSKLNITKAQSETSSKKCSAEALMEIVVKVVGSLSSGSCKVEE